MNNSFNLEDALENTISKRTQSYLKEVLSTYYNGEYRSCIVMLYATTFADALEKINTMAEIYQNEKAINFLEKYENQRKANTAYSVLEKDIKVFVVQSGIINDVELKQWEHLKDYRDYCAHPVVGEDYQLISPNAEQVKMHIRNMFEALFVKDAILTDSKLFDEFLKKAEDYYDRNQLEGLQEFITTRYISRLNFNAKAKFIKNLWKFAFYVEDEECDKYRRIAYRMLIWIIESDKNNLLNYMRENATYFNGKIKHQEVTLKKDERKIRVYTNRSCSLIYFLSEEPEVYEFLSQDNRLEVAAVSRKNINLLLISGFLYKNRKEHSEKIIQYLEGLNSCMIPSLVKEICDKASSHYDTSYNWVLIYYFFHCQNSAQWSPDFDYINATYMFILKDFLITFTYEQLTSFLEQITKFYIQAACFSELCTQIISIDKEKGFHIDFSKYDVNLKDYVHEERFEE